MIFFPMVSATAVPKRKGPKNSQTAAIVRAFLGERAPVVIIVATTLAASWNPLEKSKKSAKPTTMIAKNRIQSMGASFEAYYLCRQVKGKKVHCQ
jgi:hypothetical protein